MRASMEVKAPERAVDPDNRAESRPRPIDPAVVERLSALPARELLARAIMDEFAGRIALVSSFGAQAAVLLHLVAEVDRATPVIFLDTGKLFGETRRYRETLVAHLGLTGMRVIDPDREEVTRRDPKGALWLQNPDACCHLRKVVPLARALGPFDAWINGRKRYQAGSRADIGRVEIAEGRVKINPLADWDSTKIQAYFRAHDLPRHPLADDGYLSIGCMPCSGRVQANEGERDGRWRGQDKTECGIHLSLTSSSL